MLNVNPTVYTNRSSVYTTPVWVPNRVLQSRNPDANFREIPLSRELHLAFHLPSVLSIPYLVPILLSNPESRASNKGNPGSRKPIKNPHKRSRTRIRIKKYVVSKNQSAFVWTWPKRFSGVILMKLFQM